jgi:hypothetical protein
MKKIYLLILLLMFSIHYTNAQSKEYCISNSTGKYEITLSGDGSNNATFNLYDNNGNLKKATQGEWILRDEGVYGPSYVLTFVFTGKNANLSPMKFTCQYDGYGNLQALIDSQSRTWNKCSY